ncbi:MAG: biotin--[acetyl-CoA-carboxylase] ligase [Bacteroidia bacterium]|nr:biotin--[acetyl-CoA-carboxylase] ligase [Bacteroidia bacterium]
MNADTVRERLAGLLNGHSFGRNLEILQETGSTNDEALERARTGAPHGTVILALSQTRGRGRMGRAWSSRPGDSLTFSIVLRPESPMREAGRLTLHAGLAAHRALTRETALPYHIKWPNDILWERCKVCGILAESVCSDNRAACVVIGIGCNLNQTDTGFPLELRASARSLAQLTGRTWEMEPIAAAILRELALVIDRPWPEVLAEWKTHCTSIGKPVRIATGGEVIHGVLLDIDGDGALLLETDSGARRRLDSAEIL